MSNQRIVFTNQDGTVGVIVPAPNCPLSLAEIMQKDVPAGSLNVRQITTDELPANRNYRNAWDDSNPETFIGVNAGKAGEIAHARRRGKRVEAMAGNTEILKKNGAGIPLGPNENAADAATANAIYMTNVDDVAQVAIDTAVAAISNSPGVFLYRDHLDLLFGNDESEA